MSLSIRALCEHDINQLLDFQVCPQDAHWSLNQLSDALDQCEKGCYLALVAVDISTQKIIGYAIASYFGEQADIQNILVTQTSRGRGAGRLLMTQLVSILNSLSVASIFLEVRASNLAAVNLYLSLGFEQIQKRRNYYPGVHGDREDALVFSLACQ